MKKIFLLALFLINFLSFSQRAVILDPNDNPIEVILDPIDPDPVTTLSPPIESGEVGYTNGELSVSGTGGAVYNIPIALPPGINNVAPNISLNYSSQSGDGIAGFGWNIGGISRITRVPSTLYHDGIIDPVDFDNYDRFTLDGQRLILKTGTYGTTGSTYETENFSNLKVSFLSNGSQTYFKVEYPDGSIALYGYSAETSSVLSLSEWPITQWRNPQNLSINYKYYNYNNELHIKSIDFGTNTNTGINKIEFTYKAKNKETIYYIDSFEYRKNKILSSIKVTGNGVPYRNYYLTHDLTSTGYERLFRIHEKTGDNIKSLKPITFSYKVNQSSFSQQISYDRKGEFFGGNLIGDFSGECQVEGFSAYIINKLNQDYSVSSIVLSNAEHSIERTPINYLNSDLELNNKLGYLKIETNGHPNIERTFTIYSYDKENNLVKYEYEKNIDQIYGIGDQVNSFSTVYGGWTIPTTQRAYGGFISDFNGDKLTDFVTYKIIDGNLYIRFINLDRRLTNNFIFDTPIINVGTSTFIASGTNRYHSGTTKILQEDYNGDGITDLIVFRGNPYNKIEVYSLMNNVFVKTYELNYNLPGNIYENLKFPIFLGDFNNDNRIDFLFSWDSKIIYTRGDNTIQVELLPSTFIKPDSTKRETYLTWDLNNDGLNDIVRLEAIYESKKFKKCTSCSELWWIKSGMKINYYDKSSGSWLRTNFEQITRDEINNSIPLNAMNITFGSGIPLFFAKKFGNDNQTMLAKVGTNERYAGESENTSMFRSIAYFNFFRHMDDQTLLTRVDQGNGIAHEITYNNLMNGNGTYTTTTSQETYPYYNLLNGKENKVVSEIREISSFTKKKLYKYHGAIFDLSGRGISGFQATTVTNWFNNPSNIISTVNKFDFTKNGAIKETFSKVGLIEPNYILLPSDTFIARSINTYNHEDTDYVNPLLSNKVFKLFKTKTDNFNGQNNTSSITTVNYNTYNNPINSTTIIKNGGTVEKTTTNTFGYDGVLTSPYIVDRLNNKVSRTTLASGDVQSTEEEYIYDRNLLKQIKKRSTNSGLTSDFITENNEYDAFGNVIQKKYSAPGMADRVVNYEYDDATHRFLVKKIDPELQQTVYTYNQSTGLLLTETLPSIAGFPLITTYNYDSWGKVILVKDYLNKFVSYNYFNITGGGILKTTGGSDGSESKIIYDPLGRTLHEGYKNLNRLWSVKSTLYNIYDQPIKVYKNYMDRDTPEVWDEFTI